MDKKKPENLKLIFLAANLFLDEDYLDRLSERFNEIYGSSGLPGSLRAVAYPVPVFVNKVQDADCTQESVETVIKCYKESKYCISELWEITKAVCNLSDFKFEEEIKRIFCFIFNESLLKDSLGDAEFDDDKRTAVVTVRFGRMDAIISTVFHELYELLLEGDEGNDKDLHCNNSACYMNPDSVALTLCNKCIGRIEEKRKLDPKDP